MSKTYQLEVPGVGSFEIRRRAMAVSIAVTAEYNRLTEGQDVVSDFFGRFCTVYATLKVLIVSGPRGWDLDEMDPDDEQSYETMNKVFAAIRAQEDSFRRGISAERQSAGEGSGGVA